MTTKIDPQIFNFLRDIRENNNKPWFDAHRQQYDAARASFLVFVGEFIKAVQAVDPGVGDHEPKQCVYRFNRDIRFSPDKSPYKRHFGAFVCPGGRKSTLPGYYLHIEPDNCFFCTGNYGLPTEMVRRLRTEIANFPEELDAIIKSEPFRSRTGGELWDEEKLKKVPSGYDIAPQYADYLKYKSLNARVDYTEEEVTQTGFIDTLRSDIELTAPLNAYFRRALETEPESDEGFGI